MARVTRRILQGNLVAIVNDYTVDNLSYRMVKKIRDYRLTVRRPDDLILDSKRPFLRFKKEEEEEEVEQEYGGCE